jgi:hypothetical protein|tara:strand:- start:3774 stop:4631 length:858 start_codon:yes stop_codon:yes gene_type:complete
MNSQQPLKLENPVMSYWTNFEKEYTKVSKPSINYVAEGDFGEYIPMYQIKLPNLSPFPSTHATPIKNTINRKLSELHVSTQDEATMFFNVYGNILNGYINAIETYSNVDVVERMHSVFKGYSISGEGYLTMFKAMNKLNFSCFSLRSNTYYVGFGSCWLEDGTLLWTTAVKKEYLKYFKLCMMFGEEIDPRIYTFIVQEGFDTDTTANIPLKRAFRKYHKGRLEHGKVSIIEMDLRRMCNGNVHRPEGLTSISAYEDWKKSLTLGYVEQKTENYRLVGQSIELEA